MKYSLYKDTVHEFRAIGTSKMMAWALIRNECHAKKIIVPTMDKIEFIRDLNALETLALKATMKS